ncbi:MAG: hypothetical protein IPO62_00990 [Saprospiraceae bacterium]|nr:hypothetical protein [Saprospiraceae bacterium]MBK9629638.1 hypothetical protein [Saprospiraceae bacterium]
MNGILKHRNLRVYRKNYFFLFLFICISLFSTCTKEKINIIDDNDPTSVTNISRLKIENYVNRLFIDLVGREPLKTELGVEVDTLQANELSRDARIALIDRLMTDDSFREGERSYKAAFYLNLYNLAKVRCLESVTDGEIQMRMGQLIGDAMRDSMAGNWELFYTRLEILRKYQNLLDSQHDLYDGHIQYHQMFTFLVNNSVYDLINMNTFNFIRAVYSELLFRLPTVQEYEVAFDIIEKNMHKQAFGKYCSGKEDFIDAMIQSPSMLEGMVIWTFQVYLNRFPTPSELVSLLPTYLQDQDIRYLIRQIAVTDEYAGFK